MSTFNEGIFPLLFAYVQAIYHVIAFYSERGDRKLIDIDCEMLNKLSLII